MLDVPIILAVVILLVVAAIALLSPSAHSAAGTPAAGTPAAGVPASGFAAGTSAGTPAGTSAGAPAGAPASAHVGAPAAAPVSVLAGAPAAKLLPVVFPQNLPQEQSTSVPTTLYYSDDVDPMVTGMRYAGRPRAIYAERTSHGDEWGLEEYADGNPGEVGYDVGPIGNSGLAGRPGVRGGRRGGPPGPPPVSRPGDLTFDDGIPENWNLPSTPFQEYAVIGEDYYGAEGPTVACGQSLEMTFVGDHQPLEN